MYVYKYKCKQQLYCTLCNMYIVQYVCIRVYVCIRTYVYRKCECPCIYIYICMYVFVSYTLYGVC